VDIGNPHTFSVTCEHLACRAKIDKPPVSRAKAVAPPGFDNANDFFLRVKAHKGCATL
jgi:hypothetical protein